MPHLKSPAPSVRGAAHYATQLVAAAGVTRLEPDPEFHFSSTTFDPASKALVGETLPDGRRVSLELGTLTLRIGEASAPLRGKSLDQGALWMESQLGAPLRFPDWEMPNGPTRQHPRLDASDAQLEALAAWFALGHRALTAFAPPRGESSPIRVWPHHFDIAVLVTLDSESALDSVGLGMTPGDAGIADPYLYVTPWPYPESRATPELPSGRWNTEGWYGAMLEASTIESEPQIHSFLEAAFARLTTEETP